MGHTDSKLDQIWDVGSKIKVEVKNEVKMEVKLVKHDWNRSNRWIRSTRFRLGHVGFRLCEADEMRWDDG